MVEFSESGALSLCPTLSSVDISKAKCWDSHLSGFSCQGHVEKEARGRRDVGATFGWVRNTPPT